MEPLTLPCAPAPDAPLPLVLSLPLDPLLLSLPVEPLVLSLPDPLVLSLPDPLVLSLPELLTLDVVMGVPQVNGVWPSCRANLGL